MPFQSLQELIAWNPPPVIEFVGSNLLNEQTKMCIFSSPKMFKSIFAQQLGFCIASGTPWIGFPTVKAKVAYLQCEIPKKMFRIRVYKMAGNVAIPPGAYQFETNLRFKLDRGTDFAWLEKSIERMKPDLKVLIMDPWYKMLGIENNEAYSKTQDAMDYLIDKYEIAIVMIHHDVAPRIDPATGKAWINMRPRGPRTLEGWFDTLINVTGNIETDVRKLYFEVRHSEALMHPIEVELNRANLWLVRST